LKRYSVCCSGLRVSLSAARSWTIVHVLVLL